MGISFVVSLVFTLLIVVSIVSHISHTTLTKGHTLSHGPSQGVTCPTVPHKGPHSHMSHYTTHIQLCRVLIVVSTSVQMFAIVIFIC